MGVAGSMMGIAEHIEASVATGSGLSLKAQKLIADGLRLHSLLLRSAVQEASTNTANADRASEATARARRAIDVIRAKGQAPTVRAVAREAKCGTRTAQRALRALQTNGNTARKAQAMCDNDFGEGY